MWAGAGLSGLFFAALLAATPVPMQSELVFLGLQAAGTAPLAWLIVVASVGNTLGSCVTYGLGRSIATLPRGRWYSLSADRIARAEHWVARRGLWLLLVSWAPGGDVIVAAAGALRVPFGRFLLLVALAKTGRYAVLGGLAGGVFPWLAAP